MSLSSLKRWKTLAAVAALFAIVAGVAAASPKKEAPAPSASDTGSAAATLVASPGVLVAGVQAGSPADKAGIARGDIILTADGKAVDTPSALAATIGAKKSGDSMALQIKHGDAEKSVTVTLGTFGNRTWLGIETAGGRFGLMAGPGLGRFGNGGFRMMLPGSGAYVAAVTAGSPAETAGIKQGDFILSVDGTAVDAQHALSDLIAAKKPGDMVTLSVQSPSQAQARDVKVTLGKNPDKDAAWLGIQYTLVGPRLGGMMPGFRFGPGLAGNQGAIVPGVIVAQVAAGSPAEKAGLARRDVITKVDGSAVTEPQQVADAVAKHKPGDSMTVTVSRSGSSVELSVVLAASPSDSTKAYLGVSMAVQRIVTSLPGDGSTVPGARTTIPDASAPDAGTPGDALPPAGSSDSLTGPDAPTL
jgi:serine protease Do